MPKDLYIEKDDPTYKHSDDFVDTTIKNGGKLKLDFTCEDNGTVLK